MNNKLEVHNYAVDGVVVEIKETNGKPGDLIPERTLSFKYFNKKLLCVATVTFATDNPKVDLYKPALRFIKKLK